MLKNHRFWDRLYYNGSGPTALKGSLVNEGTIESYAFSLTCGSNITIRGGGTILLSKETADLRCGPVIQSAGHTIAGYGYISASLDNQGTIVSDVVGKTLRLNGSSKSNSGVIKTVVGGVSLVIDNGVTITQSPTGQILADGGGVVLASNTQIIGGTLNTANGGSICSGGSPTLTNVTNLGYYYNGSGPTTLNGSLVNEDMIESRGFNLTCGSNLTIRGGGTILLSNSGAELKGGLVTQSAGHTIAGFGYVTAPLDNRGTVEAGTSGQTLRVTGAVTQRSGATLTGGTWIARAGATLDFTTGSNITVNQGTVLLDGAGSNLPRINALADNQGSFAIKNGRSFTTAGPLANTGLLDIGRNCTLTASGAFNQAAGTLRVELAGAPGDPSLWSHVASTGTAALARSLEVMFSRTATYSAGDRWHFLSTAAEGRTGQFTACHFYNVPSGLMPTVEYQADDVDVVLYTATAPQTFAEWLAQQDFQNPGDDAALADPDADGIPNLLEYAFDLIPTMADAPSAGGRGVTRDGAFWLELNLPEPARADLIHTVRGTADLANWYDVARKTGTGSWTWLGGGSGRIEFLPPAPGRSLIQIGIPDAHMADRSAFLRMEATLQP